MTSDRSWVSRNRYNEFKYLTEEYKIGVNDFIKFAWDNRDPEDGGLIRCPCEDCANKYFKDPSDVKVDLYLNGIMKWYTRWDLHGERDMPRVEVAETSARNVHYGDEDIVIVRDPTNFFVDLTMFENNHFMDDYVEEQNESDDEDQNENINIDEQSDNDDLT
ncbi:hypothetical protein POM88_040992 [Heracleum sosnowskyi]|uniref:Transposase-associated domain-containing protein n=1 Tax=Heracleum sosnowskyi TaxID=360622 RepID=A0AAD8M9B2_9APIA|nr:hypothetical protein POM88_040992 [Heracleum sosnowskyi]